METVRLRKHNMHKNCPFIFAKMQVVRRPMHAVHATDSVARARDASCQSDLPRALFRLRRVWSPAEQGRPVRAQLRLAHLLPPALRAPLRVVPPAQPQLQRLVQRLVLQM